MHNYVSANEALPPVSVDQQWTSANALPDPPATPKLVAARAAASFHGAGTALQLDQLVLRRSLE